jgi:hypothetical protein
MDRRKFLQMIGLGSIGAGFVVAVVAKTPVESLKDKMNRVWADLVKAKKDQPDDILLTGKQHEFWTNQYYEKPAPLYRIVDNGINHMAEVGEGWEPSVQIGTDSKPPQFEWE